MESGDKLELLIKRIYGDGTLTMPPSRGMGVAPALDREGSDSG